jgi:hypothetical protein
MNNNKKKRDWPGMWHVWETGEVLTGFWWGNTRKRDHLEDPVVDGKMDLQEVGWKGMEWTDLDQGRYRWRALVNAVMNLRVP